MCFSDAGTACGHLYLASALRDVGVQILFGKKREKPVLSDGNGIESLIGKERKYNSFLI